MPQRGSAWLTPQFWLAVVISAVYVAMAISAIAAGDDVVPYVGILVGLPLFVVMLGLVIRRQIREE